MKILRLVLGIGLLLVTFKIGLDIKQIYAGILLGIGLVLTLTSLGRNKK